MVSEDVLRPHCPPFLSSSFRRYYHSSANYHGIPIAQISQSWWGGLSWEVKKSCKISTIGSIELPSILKYGHFQEKCIELIWLMYADQICQRFVWQRGGISVLEWWNFSARVCKKQSRRSFSKTILSCTTSISLSICL